MTERPPLYILAAQPHVVALHNERPKRQRFCSSPVNSLHENSMSVSQKLRNTNGRYTLETTLWNSPTNYSPFVSGPTKSNLLFTSLLLLILW